MFKCSYICSLYYLRVFTFSFFDKNNVQRWCSRVESDATIYKQIELNHIHVNYHTILMHPKLAGKTRSSFQSTDHAINYSSRVIAFFRRLSFSLHLGNSWINRIRKQVFHLEFFRTKKVSRKRVIFNVRSQVWTGKKRFFCFYTIFESNEKWFDIKIYYWQYYFWKTWCEKSNVVINLNNIKL